MNHRPQDSDLPSIEKLSITKPCIRVHWSNGSQSQFHGIWLRDNCGCGNCRVTQSGERLLYTPDIPDDLDFSHA